MASIKSRIEKLEEQRNPKASKEAWEQARIYSDTFGGPPEGFIREDGTCIGLEELVSSSMEPDSSGGNRNDA